MNPEHIAAQVLLRAWPFQRGVSRIIRTLDPSFAAEFATVPTSDGLRLRVVPNDLIGRHIYLTGEYDPSVVYALCDFARRGDVLLDVGANIGYVSASFLHKIPGSHVIAVEPQSGVVGDLLAQNLSQFPERYQILPVAMSDRSGRASFRVDGSNLGDGRIGDGDGEITMATGDDLLRDVAKIDLIKMDIQGHELTALLSMKSTLQRLKPRAILFEDENGQLREIAAFLTLLGYKTWGIRNTIFGHRFENISHRACDNYVATLT